MSELNSMIQDAGSLLGRGDMAGAFLLFEKMIMQPLKVLHYQKICRLIDEHRDNLADFVGGRTLRLAILGGYTTHPICVSLRVHLLVNGCLADIYESAYNAYKAEIIDPNSAMYQFNPDMVLMAVGVDNVQVYPEPGAGEEGVHALASAAVDEFKQYWLAIRMRTNAVIVQHNFSLTEEAILGRLEHKYLWSKSQYLRLINDKLWAEDGGEMHILDVFRLSIRKGIENWRDLRWYHHSKHGFDPNWVSDYANCFAGLYRAIVGTAKKCIVTDLDNTLWGGVAGDDGPLGIQLGSISPEGEAYAAFCKYLKNLKDRGVLLAICSKNERKVVDEVFAQHPEMPLKLSDFSSVQCNWSSKSQNLQEIIKELHIGADAIVFIDDSPVECLEVKGAIPDVTTIEMDCDPAHFIRKIDDLHLFDQLNITEEDKQRSASYKVQAAMDRIGDSEDAMESFLASLEMAGRIGLASTRDVPRAEQLFKKTNQFNLTSLRYDAAELTGFIESEDSFCAVCWLKDRFTSYGLVSAMVARFQGDRCIIQNWVMSCRVFSRTLEQFFFEWLQNYALDKGCRCINADFVATPKNGYIQDLLGNIGFKKVDNKDFGEWEYDLSTSFYGQSFVCHEEPT